MSMVLDDIYSAPKPKQDISDPKRSMPVSRHASAVDIQGVDLYHDLATPQDRLAAISADLVIFLPLVMLCLAPIRRISLENQILGIDQDWIRLLAVGIIFIAAAAYQTFSLLLWGATPGKLFIGLRVRSIWNGEKPTAMQSFVRALLHSLQLLLLAVPWISLFSNPRRRVLHDRASDTIVVVHSKRKGAGPPHPYEISMASGMQFAVLSSLLIFTVFQFRGSMTDVASGEGGGRTTESQIIRELESTHVLCRVVGEAHRDWLGNGETKSATRVEAALALFAAGIIESDCLEKEADYVLWRKNEKREAYLAKALANQDNVELIESYQKKICTDENSSACQVLRSEVIFLEEPDSISATVKRESSGVDQYEKSAREMFDFAMRAGEAEYVRVFTIRNLFAIHDLKRVLLLLQKSSPHYLLGSYYSSIRAKAYYLVHQDANSMQNLRSSLDGLTIDQRQETAAWFCYAQTFRGCDSSAKLACDMHLQFVNTRADSVAQDAKSVIAAVRAGQCWEDEWQKSNQTLLPLVSQELLQVLKSSSGPGSNGNLREVLESESTVENFALRAEALRQILAQGSDINEQIQEFETGSFEWVELARLQMQKYENDRKMELAWNLGKQIASVDPYNMPVLKRMVVLGHRLGHINDAHQFVKELATQIDDSRLDFARPTGRRLPASLAESQEESLGSSARAMDVAADAEFFEAIKGLKP